MIPTADIPDTDLRYLHDVMTGFAAAGGRRMSALIPRAMVNIAQGARRGTPIAKRRKMRNLQRVSRKRRATMWPRPPWWAAYEIITIRKGRAYSLYARTRQGALKIRIPERRGLAKSSWFHALNKALPRHRRDTIDPKSNRILRRATSGRSQLDPSGTVIGMEIVNRVRYIPAIAPTAASRGVQSAANRLAAQWARGMSATNPHYTR